ncbi:MAG TPA: 3-deoxy-D-manno-octulosonic acid transferase [Gemmataceae bacterium]|nr:3-deoxy-D-manno-octulosonic acid transferase [Gemmataceae bacterium]
MSWFLNLIYLVVLFGLSPWLIWRMLRKGRYRRGRRAKLFGLSESLPAGAVWFHGVSVGEIHLLRQVVAAFRKRYPDLPCVISTTTDTGFDEAHKCFPGLFVFPFPLDFSWAVRRTLRRLCPRLIVLAEAELWPNFLMAAQRQGVPIAVINGRMSPRSLRRYQRLGPLPRWLFGKLDLLLMQTEHYARGVRILGAHPERVHVTGTVKFDGVRLDRRNPDTHFLREMLEVKDGERIWIAGSTQAPEEEIVLGIWQRLRIYHPTLRLFLVPRQKDRFEEVAQLLERSGVAYARRSSCADLGTPVVLVDTIGELGALWGLAEVAFIGGSLDGRRGGQNMIDAAAFGAAVVFGPHVWNFAETAARLIEAKGACQIADAGQLETVLRLLLEDAAERQRLGTAARDFVLSQQGATEQTVALLGELLEARRLLAA